MFFGLRVFIKIFRNHNLRVPPTKPAEVLQSFYSELKSYCLFLKTRTSTISMCTCYRWKHVQYYDLGRWCFKKAQPITKYLTQHKIFKQSIYFYYSQCQNNVFWLCSFYFMSKKSTLQILRYNWTNNKEVLRLTPKKLLKKSKLLFRVFICM